ncbi:KilA-N domain-containing protein [Chamaesiphon sp. OTE_75_metabat_556]|uniref:KilA-N domain-containing protein n=1 Tax=Chamaesiphon sp. OTE_75_metabat_556 TaxID=2964692 RepID=UPI00286C97B0|nr:KilA-N domain-containing protein [Chamaesiphon sp. OTE_75_metabat_556]
MSAITTIETFRLNQYNGKNIRIDPHNRYVCLTDMAVAAGKQVGHWLSLQGTTAYIEGLSSVIAIPITELVIAKQGGVEQGTWAHPKAAIKFAAWCSVDFEIQVTSWIDDLLQSGSVHLNQAEPLTQMQMIAQMALEMDRRDRELKFIKQQQALEAARIDELTQLTHQHDGEIDRIFNPDGHYFSVIGYASLHGLKIGRESAKAIGSKCSAYCRKNGISIEKLTDPRFGTVGSYPESVIAQYI